jgi:hypothetical protein
MQFLNKLGNKLKFFELHADKFVRIDKIVGTNLIFTLYNRVRKEFQIPSV